MHLTWSKRDPHGLYETEWSDNFWMFQSCFVARAVEMQRLIRMEAICSGVCVMGATEHEETEGQVDTGFVKMQMPTVAPYGAILLSLGRF